LNKVFIFHVGVTLRPDMRRGELVGAAAKGGENDELQHYPPFRAKDDGADYACCAKMSIVAQLWRYVIFLTWNA
jgi:hypothetical protein